MAETLIDSGLEITRWRRNYFREYTRASRFAPYMGRGLENIIVTMYELQTEAGKTIIVPFVGKLTGSGVSGSQILEGNEEDLGTGNMPVSVDWRRNAVIVPKSTQTCSMRPSPLCASGNRTCCARTSSASSGP